jgi:MFS family permease
MGYIGATIAIAGIAAPILGGFLTGTVGWEYIFLINVPIGIIIFFITLKYLKLQETITGTLTMDWYGAGLMVTSVVSLILLMSELASNLALSVPAIVYGSVFVISTPLFYVAERCHPRPLLDLSVLRIREFIHPSTAMFLIFIALFMVNLIGPFYLEVVMNLTPAQVGLVFIIIPIIIVVASPLSGWLYDRYESRYFSAVGIAISGISLLFLSAAVLTRNLPMIVFCFIPLAIGTALFQGPNNTEVMRGLPVDKTGIASSLSATIKNLGATFGVSLSSILLALQLHASGYFGPITEVDPVLFSSAITAIMIAGAVFCFIGRHFVSFAIPANRPEVVTIFHTAVIRTAAFGPGGPETGLVQPVWKDRYAVRRNPFGGPAQLTPWREQGAGDFRTEIPIVLSVTTLATGGCRKSGESALTDSFEQLRSFACFIFASG